MLRWILSPLKREFVDQQQEAMARIDTATLKKLTDMTHAVYLLTHPNLNVKSIL